MSAGWLDLPFKQPSSVLIHFEDGKEERDK